MTGQPPPRPDPLRAQIPLEVPRPAMDAPAPEEPSAGERPAGGRSVATWRLVF